MNDFLAMGIFSPNPSLGGVATYTMNTGTVIVAGDFTVNQSSANTVCTFSQTAGSVTVSNKFFLGRNADGATNTTGRYFMNAGTLSIGPEVWIGLNGGTGTYIQSNGNVTASGFVTIGVGGLNVSNGVGRCEMYGGTLSIGGDFSVNEDKVQSCIFTQAAGTVNLNGTSLNIIGRSSVGQGIYSISGGSLNVSTNADLQIAGRVKPNANGVLNVSGTANVTVGDANSIFALVVGRSSNGVGVVNQTGGTVTVSPNSTFGVWLGPGLRPEGTNSPAASGIYNLNGGVLTTGKITPDSTNSVKAFNFGGGTLVANASFTVVTAPNFTTTINAGGSKIDTAGFDITWNPGFTGAGALTKLGTGALVLNGTNTFAGATTVSNGTLRVNGILDNPVTVVSGATLGGNGVLTGAVTVSGTLAPGNSAGTLTISNNLTLNPTTTLTYELGTSSDRTVVSGTLTLDGTINVTDNGLTNGNYTIFTYGSLTDNGLTVGTLPGGASGTVSNDTVGKQILLVVSGAISDPFVTWQFQYFGSTSCPLCGGSADFDGDGMSNSNEFLAGFNPTNSAAYVHILSEVKSGNDMVLTYLGANGDAPRITSRTNVLEFTAGDGNGSYSNSFVSTGKTNILSGGTGVGIVTNMVDTGGATASPSRYYRVRVLAP